MTQLPSFNQVAFTYQTFTVPDDPFVWPKVFQAPDHRIVLPSTVAAIITVDAGSANQQLRLTIGGGPIYKWQYLYPTILTAGSTFYLYIHTGPIFPLATPPDQWLVLSMPPHIYLYSLDFLALQLQVLGATDDITDLEVSGRAWIL